MTHRSTDSRPVSQASGQRPRSQATGARRNRRVPILSASTADKYVLYERSVQDPQFELGFIERVFRNIRHRRPLSLREDFCGTALLCARWVESHPERTATGVDLDPRVLAWGTRHHLAPLGQTARRVRLLEQDVRAPSAGKFDTINALNFSYWVFKTRAEMLHYFRTARSSLNKDGVFFIDAYGGWEAVEPMTERRRIRGGFTYIWDQSRIDPITHDITNHIHFEFPDGSKMQKAFTYEWRFWSLPELMELLGEAGYSEVRVYWDDGEDDEETDYRPRRHAENQPGWLAYLVAVR
jgi:hypothetical protein